MSNHALRNSDVLRTYLKDFLLSEAVIVSQVEDRDHIFEIKSDQSTLGYISLDELKAYIFEHEDEAINYFVRNIDSTEWKVLFEHPFFQRRKPQIVSNETIKDDDDLAFYILQNGQKVGPFKKNELMDKVDSKEILLSNMASYNGGATWMKLFQIEGFNRRSLKESDQLPGKPSEKILSKVSRETHGLTETTDAISTLAYLGNIKRGKASERERMTFTQDETITPVKSNSIYKWLLVGSVIGIIYFLYSIKSHLNSPFGSEQAPYIGEQAEVLTPVNDEPINGVNNIINNQSRQNGKLRERDKTLFPVRKAVPRKSFMETKPFKDQNADERPTSSNDDGNYFFDNVSPVETDPVRAQISKENYENGGQVGEPAPAPDNDTLFNQEVSN